MRESMSNLFKVAMFITSFLPLWITVIFIDCLSIVRMQTHLYTEIIGLVVILIGTILSSIIIYWSLKTVKPTDYKPYQIQNAVQEKGITSEFLLSYILPLFAFDFTVWENVIQFLIYFCILAFLCIRNNNVYANLIFEGQRYKFYTCELIWTPESTTPPIQTIVISRTNLCANKGNTIEVAPLNKPFYLMRELTE